MFANKIKEMLNDLQKSITYIELLCSNGALSFIDELANTINEFIEFFIELSQKINEVNTFSKYISEYNESSEKVSSLLVQVVKSFELNDINSGQLNKLVAEFYQYKKVIINTLNNSLNDLSHVYYEIKKIKNKDYLVIYFAHENSAYVTKLSPINICEISNKADFIIIDSIRSEKIKNILLNENYDPRIIKLKDELKVELPHFSEREVSDLEYPLLHLNLKRVDMEYNLLTRDSDLTVISNNCWGGYLYSKCGIEYTSPLVWTFIETRDFIRLVKDIRYYFNYELEFIVEKGITYPIAMLYDIKIYFPHYSSNSEVEEKWYKRLKRVNYDNILVQANIEEADDALEFNKINIEKKIAFTSFENNLESCVYLENWPKDKLDNEKYQNFSQYSHLRSWEYFDLEKYL